METSTPRDLLERAARRWPDAPALRIGGDTWTFNDLDYAANEIGGRVPGGARIAFRAEMSAATVAAVWGIPRGGGVAVPIDPGLGVVAARARAESFDSVLGWPPPPDHEEADVPPTPSSPALIVATSGSSGAPRGVVLTRRNIEAAAAASQIHLGTRAADVWLLVVPLHHVSGLAILWRAAHDGSQVLLHDGFSASAVASELEHDVTWVSLVPTMLERLLPLKAAPWPQLRGALIGGARAADQLIAAANAFGIPAVPTYGMTETTAQVATVRPGAAGAALGTVGFPLPGVEVTIQAAPGIAGTILIDGPTVSPGYVGEAPRRGPLVTSDIGFFDISGRLVVVGRGDDVIFSGGEKVHPAIVEAALREHPGVDSAAVVGIPDDEWGERVVAVVAGTAGDAEELIADLRSGLARHEVPKEIRFVEELPHLSNGKIDRVAVRRLAGEQW